MPIAHGNALEHGLRKMTQQAINKPQKKGKEDQSKMAYLNSCAEHRRRRSSRDVKTPTFSVGQAGPTKPCRPLDSLIYPFGFTTRVLPSLVGYT